MPAARPKHRFRLPVFRICGVCLGLVIAAVGVAWLLLTSPSRAAADARAYAGSQVLGIANSYLVPSLSFETIDYEPPRMIRLGGVALTAADGTRVVAADTMEIDLAEVPRRGEPIRITRLAVSGGEVLVLGDGEGGFKGLRPFVKADPTRAPGDVRPEFRLSRVLELRRLEVERVGITYDRGGDGPQMRLDALSLAMDIEPAEDSAQTGWYAAEVTAGRAPGLEIDLAGRFNVDTLAVDVPAAAAEITADEKTLGTLPGPVQTFFRDHAIRGRLAAGVSIEGRLRGGEGLRFGVDLEGDGLHSEWGDLRVPIARLRARLDFASGVLEFPSMHAEALDGRLSVSGRADFEAADRPLALSWEAESLEISELLAAQSPEEEGSQLAGRFSGEGELRVRRENGEAELGGRGVFEVAEGRLVLLPGVTQLADRINPGDEGEVRTSNHSAEGAWVFDPAGMRFTELELTTNSIAARGTGVLGFDRTLDFRVNAGPLEKVQSLLGPVGDIFGAVTDSFVKYTIKGTISEPVVGVAPFGIGG